MSKKESMSKKDASRIQSHADTEGARVRGSREEPNQPLTGRRNRGVVQKHRVKESGRRRGLARIPLVTWGEVATVPTILA